MVAFGIAKHAARVGQIERLRRDAPLQELGDAPARRVAVAARVVFVRNTGKLCFATLREGDGTELQAMLSLDRVGADALAAWKAGVDIGDHVAVGQIIGLIEAMKLFNEIKSDVAGRVVRIAADNGALVKARQTLLEVEPL